MPPVSRQQIFFRGLRGRCPNCGAPLRFEDKMRLREQCPECLMPWRLQRDGFFLGAMVCNYSVTVALLVPFVVAPLVKGWISSGVAIALGLAISLVFPLLFYKMSWSLWLGLYYFFLPNELPANDPDDAPPRR